VQQSLLNSAASTRHFRNGWLMAVIGTALFALKALLAVMAGVSLLGKR
jgi:hypothetical protein